jgi:thiamine pyrophosphokinase
VNLLKALIVADGDVDGRDLLDTGLLDQDADGPPLVIAADGGALKAQLVGLTPDLVIGDADSLAQQTIDRLRSEGIEVRVHPQDKAESDTELCLREAVRRGATKVVILGALGGLRFEHSVANLLLLTLPELADREVVLADPTTSVRVMGSRTPDRLELRGLPGDLISLLPLTEVVDGVRTTGLAYALAGEPLVQGPARGLSNVMQADEAAISIEGGRLAVIHSRLRAEAPAGG